MEAAWIVSNFTDRFLNDQGLVSRNCPPTRRTIFDNFNDIVPFMLHFGAEDFLLTQIGKLSAESFEMELPLGNVLYSYKIEEYLGGLYRLHQATGSPEAKSLLDDAIAKCLQYFLREDDHFAEAYDFQNKRVSPFFSPWSAGILETFVEMAPMYPELVELSERILRKWCSHPFFLKHGLFPARGTFSTAQNLTEQFFGTLSIWSDEYPCRTNVEHGAPLTARGLVKAVPGVYSARRLTYMFARSGQWARLMKSNTTPVFCMIELHEITGGRYWRDMVLRWVDAALGAFVNDAGVGGRYVPGRGASHATLVDGSVMIDVLCDTWWSIEKNDRYLDAASRIAEACLAWQWENGLIPMTADSKFDHLDGQVDFSISLRRIAELADRPDLHQAGYKLTKKAYIAHKTPEGLCTHVDRHGAIGRLPTNTIDPKYNGLALKGLANLETRDRRMYGDRELMDLFQDR